MRQSRNFVSGLNYYVPAMQAAADLGQLLHQRMNLGKPAAAVANSNDISNAGIVANSGTTTTVANLNKKSDAPFGRNVTVKASGATGANVLIDVYGRDYLGQAMIERITVANADGTNTVQGVKAFQYVDKIVHNGGASNAVTISAGWGGKFGLPYVTIAALREFADNVAANAGTFVAPSFTDPQTATTADPRGLYTPTTTPNGAKLIEVDVEYSNYVNANNRGGLHGIPHYAG